MATAQELLDVTEQAIIDCLAAQAYTVRGRSKQAAELAQLMKAREQLKREVSDGTQSCYVGRYVQPVN